MANIVIIDDDEAIRTMLRQVFEIDGHTVADLPSGLGALSLCRELGADLAIVDLLMPDQEGLQTIQSLCTSLPELKIIAMSGGGRFIHTEFLDVAARMGAHRTLAKPFGRSTVLELVHELLDANDAAAENEP